jgi:hypothetical protein
MMLFRIGMRWAKAHVKASSGNTEARPIFTLALIRNALMLNLSL